jgi:hypothetical protein
MIIIKEIILKNNIKPNGEKLIQVIMENNPIWAPKTTIILKVNFLKGATCFLLSKTKSCHRMLILHYNSNKRNLQT